MSFSIGTKTEYLNRKTQKMKPKIEFDFTFIDSLQFMSSSLSQLVEI